MARCVICSAAHATCGPATTMPGTDQRIERRDPTVGLKRYEAVVNGTPTVLVLSAADAKLQGLTETVDEANARRAEEAEVAAVQAAIDEQLRQEAEAKARADAEAKAKADAEAKAKVPANKAATPPANK